MATKTDAGSSLTYRLTESKNGYDLTNITVYGGWADGNRDQQAYTVYYSTVTAPAIVYPFGQRQLQPIGSCKRAVRHRVTLTPATGVLASNVAAVKFDFTSPTRRMVILATRKLFCPDFPRQLRRRYSRATTRSLTGTDEQLWP